MSDRTESAGTYGTTPPTGGATVVPPRVNAAFWLYIAGAVLSLIALIVSVATIGSVTASLQQQNGGRLSGSAASAAVGAGVTIAVVFGILYIAAYVIFAVFMRRGANWARIVLLVVTVLSVFGVLGGYGLGAARLIVGVIATILIFTKPANDYFRSSRVASAPGV
jgi:hypothetical protein